MPKAFFKRYGNATVRIDGKKLDWASLNSMTSVVETEDDGLAKHLRDIIASKNPAGIRELQPEEYHTLKKKLRNWMPSVHAKEAFREQNVPQLQAKPRRGADVAAADEPAPRAAGTGPATVAASELPDLPE